MKPLKEKLLSNLAHSFRVKHSVLPYLDSPWHYHDEYELFYIIKSSGKRFVGNSIDNFSEGDMVFMGPNLPHVWKNNGNFYDNLKKNNAEAIVIQFKENVFGKDFFSLPELKSINEFLQLSKRGLLINGSARNQAAPLIKQITHEEGIDRIITLLKILNILSGTSDIIPLASKSFEKIYFDDSGSRIDKVFAYVANNFDKEIKLEKAAKIAGMTETAFCRYFKQRTLKTFFQYLIEVRLSYACKLLIDREKTIGTISIECGFKNVSYFIKQFKKVYRETPAAYRRKLFNVI